MSSREELDDAKRTYEPESRPAKRLAELPKRVEVGSQIVSSRHIFNAGDLRNVGLSALSVIPLVQNDEPIQSFWAVTRAGRVQPHDSSPLEVLFQPSTVGEHRAKLQVRIMEEEGAPNPEVREVELVGHGKLATTLPPASERPTLETPAVSTPPPDVTKTGVADLHYYTENAKVALGVLSQQQHDAVEEVEKQVTQFKPAEPKGKFWIALADFALNLGLAGIASSVGKLVAAELAELGKSADFGGVIADVVKEGIKSSGKAAVGIGSDTATTGPDQFFERQRVALANMKGQSGYTINNTEANLRLQDPVTAANAMRVVWTQLDAHQGVAHDLQKRATSTQWMSALARTDSGTRQANDEPGHEVDATSMSRAGEQQVLPRHKTLASGGPVRGVLQIAVNVDEPLGERVPKFQIKQAWIHGVPAAMGKDLATANLAALPVPVVLRLEGADVTQITRDELGVIEVHNRQGGDMAQAHRTAKDLLDLVLWISLADRGVRVETDDQ